MTKGKAICATGFTVIAGLVAFVAFQWLIRQALFWWTIWIGILIVVGCGVIYVVWTRMIVEIYKHYRGTDSLCHNTTKPNNVEDDIFKFSDEGKDNIAGGP